MRKIKAFAPATVANFIIGFDSLGAAVEEIVSSEFYDDQVAGNTNTKKEVNNKRLDEEELFGDLVVIDEINETAATCFFEIQVKGRYAHMLPIDNPQNIVYRSCLAFHQALDQKDISLKRKNFSITLFKGLPVCSGLGSSSASIVATFIALNDLYQYPFNKQELLLLAGEMEGQISGTIHYDNVAPALLGGLQLMLPGKTTETLPIFENWLLVIYHPGIEISTKSAREILPKSVDLIKAIIYSQRLASLIHSLYQGNPALASSLLHDELIEPHRSTLIPNFALGREAALKAGALAFGISGSGPSCVAIVDSLDKAYIVQTAIIKAMQDTDYHLESKRDSRTQVIRPFSKICKISSKAAKIL